MKEASHLYALAIGSNRRHGRFGKPAGVVEAAIARLDAQFDLFDAARSSSTKPSAALAATSPIPSRW